MIRRCLLTCVLLALAVSADILDSSLNEDGDDNARILTTKMLHNRYLVQSQEMVFEYTLYNVGRTAAVNVLLEDDNFSSEADFGSVAGRTQWLLPRLAPGANVSHVVVVRPWRPGYVNFTSAVISYLPTPESTERVVSLSSQPRIGVIIPFRDFDKKFSSHLLDWLIFALLTSPSLGIPFFLWYSSKSKYDRIIREKRAESGKKRE